MPYKKKRFPLPAWIFTGIFIGIILKLFVVDFLYVSGISMEHTLHNGSVIIVNKLAYGIVMPGSSRLLIQWATPQSGDIVIYLHDNKIVVKRCVAVGGTKLDYSTDSGYSLIVGGKTISLSKNQYNNMRDCNYVPNGYILSLGDNYDNSVDSRTYGFVSAKNILGKVIWK